VPKLQKGEMASGHGSSKKKPYSSDNPGDCLFSSLLGLLTQQEVINNIL
jgi:hypothetical protein